VARARERRVLFSFGIGTSRDRDSVSIMIAGICPSRVLAQSHFRHISVLSWIPRLDGAGSRSLRSPRAASCVAFGLFATNQETSKASRPLYISM
jgi:hypothetical protein